MRHIELIKKYIGALLASTELHMLILVSPPGWGKSTLVDAMLTAANMGFQAIGSYSTPLYFYNCLCDFPDDVLVLDDCAGLFTDKIALTHLRAATWSSAGSGGKRRVAWGSTCKMVAAPFVDFTGKLILLTNVFPKGKETEALQSRAFFYEIRLDRYLVEELLLSAAKSKEHFDNPALAGEVVQHIIDNLDCLDWSKLNFRSLKMAYDFAQQDPDGWKEMLAPLLPSLSPKKLVTALDKSGEPVKKQCEDFQQATGLSRRTYFNYRKELGLESHTQSVQIDSEQGRAL